MRHILGGMSKTNSSGFAVVVLVSVLVAGLGTGCKTQPYKSPDSYKWSGTTVHKLEGPHDQKVRELAFRVTETSPTIHPREAQILSDAAIKKAEVLREEYDVFGPPLMHNFMVNTGFRERGLCYQWAEDMYPVLQDLNLKTVRFHRAVALRGHLREHSAIVVTGLQQSFYDGLVLDPWKYSGRLAWIKVTDSKYPWRPFDEIPPGMAEAWEKHEARKNSR